MREIKTSLYKHRKIGLIVLFVIALLGYLVNRYYPFSPPSYVAPQWRMPLVYFLIAYKIIELGIFYLLFYRKHYLKLLETQFHTHLLEKFEKNAKRFFFLVPQGSIVFGILSYKLSGEIGYLWLFLAIALSTLLLVNPKKLEES
jgi:hypothetical protein